MWHSKDYGETFTKIEGVQEADTIGYSKASSQVMFQYIQILK